MKTRLVSIALVLALAAQAADLKPETLSAWDSYVRSAKAKMQERLQPGRHFLELDQEQDSISRVRNGEVIVLHDDYNGMKKVPSGLIHDWSAVAFIAGADHYQVFSVIRDYDRYKDFYSPTVVDSRTLSYGRTESRFSVILMNKSILVNSAIDGDYESRFFRVDDRHWYSISETTRMREIEDYGTPEQRELSDGEGSGLLWRLFSIVRIEERDGGVYVEVEAIALSRRIPVSLRWLIEPIVSRVSRNSLMTSLRQTEDAVGSRATVASASVVRLRAGTR